MTFDKCIEEFKKYSEDMSFDNFLDVFIQFKIIGKECGSFYIHIVNEKMKIIDGEYKDRDVIIIITLSMLDKIINGNLDPVYAYTTGKFNMLGDINLGRKFLTKIKE